MITMKKHLPQEHWGNFLREEKKQHPTIISWPSRWILCSPQHCIIKKGHSSVCKDRALTGCHNCSHQTTKIIMSPRKGRGLEAVAGFRELDSWPSILVSENFKKLLILSGYLEFCRFLLSWASSAGLDLTRSSENDPENVQLPTSWGFLPLH